MEKNYSQSLIDTWQYSREEAVRLGSSMLNPEHLLLGILRNSDCEAASKLAELNVNLAELKSAIENNYRSTQLAFVNPDDVVDSKPISRIRLFMHSEAISLGSNEINTNHLMLAILKVPSNLLMLLGKFNIEYDFYRMSLEIGEWEFDVIKNDNRNDSEEEPEPYGQDFDPLFDDREYADGEPHRSKRFGKNKAEKENWFNKIKQNCFSNF